ncbi:DEAD/DEAH box helicase family protein [Hyphobacterium sp. CCMP332]|uniref:DEAD/DEAH box helicase n=1 Tax=Hyphobacterium sp. CCMP332 TaxID=2749086 RepID=UPI00164FC52D|nr:DEAD/DEAH box helicase [Hyphobacterium sp. CCMP332]QNL18859.1 DEAD/DEAH box helicase family protein [Hyphobacterium sp. CCMP332]
MTSQFAPGDLVRARGREWVTLPSPDEDWLLLRPLSGAEADSVLLRPDLELEPIAPARFDLPIDAKTTVQSMATLLADALKLTLRRGAGPFRSAAQLAFEPRAYQLVPLLMALRLQVPRLVIADDVGIGKTIEAGLILRELMDRGEVDAFAVLCPPHLVEQWINELKDRFGIEAAAVTASSASKLERGLTVSQTLFDAHPFTVVSLDYIKAERRRDAFARACPKFVIVDEAHTCVGTHKGRQQRFDLLSGLAEDEDRALVMLTATPHSGDEEAFSRLLSLIHPEFAGLAFEDERYRERLARHYVQRRRIDITSAEWKEDQTFPEHKTAELPYNLSPSHRDFQEAVLDYCFGQVTKAGEGKREQRLAFWGTLALMRCVGSSPAAALSALRNRVDNQIERLEPQIYDDDGDDEDAIDIEPAAAMSADQELEGLVALASDLVDDKDPKLDGLIKVLKPLLKEGANPVVFCRYIATAEHVRDRLKNHFKKIRIEAVTGTLTPDERRDRVAEMAEDEQRLLVATDCLSEGINLQQLFDTVIHYDLSWNPTRHQQREGRVDRFGQPAKVVRSVLMFSPDSAIDGAVLDVILRKAETIRRATGVTVPLPDERGPVTDALMSALSLKRSSRQQYALDFGGRDALEDMDRRWRNAEENEKKSRARFAQNAMKPAEVIPEWEKAKELVGTPVEAYEFVSKAMAAFDAPLEKSQRLVKAPIHGITSAPLRERLKAKGLQGTLRIALAEPAPAGMQLLSRTHPLTFTLADALVEGALDPEALPGLNIGRVGAWPTPSVDALTHIAVLRLRYKLTVHARKERLLLAEEASVVAIRDGKVLAIGEDARAMLATLASSDLNPGAKSRLIASAHEALPGMIDGPLSAHIAHREAALSDDHARLRAAAGGTSRVSVEAVQPPDVIGLFTLVPAGV